VIRFAKIEDLPEIEKFDLYEGSRKEEILNETCLVFDTKHDDIAGYISWKIFGFVGNPLITYLMIQEKYRRRGYGSMLLLQALDKIESNKIFISTEENNLIMKKLLIEQKWNFAGLIQNANDDGIGEEFYYALKPLTDGNSIVS